MGWQQDIENAILGPLYGVRDDVKQHIQDMINGLFNRLSDDVNGMISPLKNDINNIGSSLRSDVYGAISPLTNDINLIKNKFGVIQTDVENIPDDIKNFQDTISADISGIASEVTTSVAGTIQPLINLLKQINQFISMLPDKIKTFFTELYSKIQVLIQNVIDAINSISPAAIWKSIKTTVIIISVVIIAAFSIYMKFII